MFSNINPYVCCNQDEFADEIKFLREKTFRKISERLLKLNVNFDPVLIDYSDTNDYVRSGHLLRLLLTNIKKCSPFFIGLIGHKYGPYLAKSQVQNIISTEPNVKLEMNWLEKNYLIAAQTGFNSVINVDTFCNSLLDHQIAQALADQNAYPFYRFYFRQFEYFEDIYTHLPIEERKQEFRKHEAENEYCDFKIKEIKMKLAKKGLIIRYYKSLEQLNDYIYDDFIDLVRVFLSTSSNFLKTRHLLKTESLVFNKLNQAVFTDNYKYLSKSIDNFLRPRQSFNVSFKLDNDANENDFRNDTENFQMESFDADFEDDKEDFLEILKLRHLNLSSTFTPAPSSKTKQIFVVHGPRGKGKTTFMASLYQKFIVSKNLKTSTKSHIDTQEPFCLFYFLEPEDYLINTLVNITSKLRAKYLKKDSNKSLDSDLYDLKSIIEQFSASLLLGPAYIFIDGLSELDPSHNLNPAQWLPNRLDDSECKFIFMLRNSSDFYKELTRRSDCVYQELNALQNDLDYEKYFKKYLCVNDDSSTNVLYSKFLNFYNELKTSEHIQNPLFLSLISLEIFSFDREIFRSHPVNYSRLNSVASSVDSSLVEGREIVSSRSSASSLSSNSVNIMNSYIEEVSTIREIIQKIIKRYLRKNNWTTNTSVPLSLENPGWAGEALCLIALSINGINKESILRILKKRGYDENLKITELYWNIFRMQYGNFLQDGLNGAIMFSHVYFKEAVQALLLDGFSVKVDLKTEETTASFRKNISLKQKEIHLLLIRDILENRLSKTDFDSSAQIQSSNVPNAENISQNVLKLLQELIYHLFMIFDLRNLFKFISSFKLLQIFESNRLKYMNEWFDLCYLIKNTRTYEENRVHLIKNLTQNIPQYEFEIVNNHIELKQFEKSEDYKMEVYSKTETDQEESLELVQVNESIDKLIDNLVDSTSIEYLDSPKLLLINRSLILNDLMKFLDDKIYQEHFSFSIMNFVHNIVTQNYPLTDTEKLRYSYLLEQLSKMSIQINNIDYGLKFLIKSIEILEDLFETFNVSNLDRKFKTKMQLLQISNRLSLLHSQMSLLLLKMNNLSGAEILLSKAQSYNSEQLTSIIQKLDKKLKFDKSVPKSELSIQETKDLKNLIYRESLEEYVKSQRSNINDIYLNTDDGGSYESKFHYLFISGLFEVQQMNFPSANRFFQRALDLSKKWYGKFHSNTSKIYHYYGCFFSLSDMDFYNPRRAELYLRKALYIKEKDKKTVEFSQDLQKTANLLSSSSFYASLSSNESQMQLLQQSSEFNQNNQNKRLNINDDQNMISEILFDLGGLLSTFDSLISIKEALECLRRSLDIKILLLGTDHDDCEIIKTKLNEVLSQIARVQSTQQVEPQQSQQLSRESMSILGYSSRPVSSWKSNSIIQSKKNLENINNNKKKVASANSKNNLDTWIRQNSVLEMIGRPKLTKRNDPDFQMARESSQNDINIFNTQIEPLKKQNTFDIPKSQSVVHLPEKSRTMIHKRNCKIPTSLTIDSHNEKFSVNGPNSSLKNLLIKNDDLKLKISKKIYYKSAWYDLPHGSNQNRFKRFVKLTPNA